jgi:1,4-alpha-glucan branching enzyme
MIRKLPSTHPGVVRIVFELPACVWADRIFVSGDFNGWSTDNLAMVQERDGVWRATIELPANRRYQFRYLIDGQWQTEWHADGFADSGHGSQNSVLETSLPAAVPTIMQRAARQSRTRRSASEQRSAA